MLALFLTFLLYLLTIQLCCLTGWCIPVQHRDHIQTVFNLQICESDPQETLILYVCHSGENSYCFLRTIHKIRQFNCVWQLAITEKKWNEWMNLVAHIRTHTHTCVISVACHFLASIIYSVTKRVSTRERLMTPTASQCPASSSHAGGAC